MEDTANSSSRLAEFLVRAEQIAADVGASAAIGMGVILDVVAPEAETGPEAAAAVSGSIAMFGLAYVVHKLPKIHSWMNRRIDELFNH